MYCNNTANTLVFCILFQEYGKVKYTLSCNTFSMNVFPITADALSKVARERPTDPIQYVADYLHNLKPDEDEETLHYEETEEQQNEDANYRKSRNPSPIKDPADDLEPDDDNTEAKKTNEDGPDDEKRDEEENGEVQSKASLKAKRFHKKLRQLRFLTSTPKILTAYEDYKRSLLKLPKIVVSKM